MEPIPNLNIDYQSILDETKEKERKARVTPTISTKMAELGSSPAWPDFVAVVETRIKMLKEMADPELIDERVFSSKFNPFTAGLRMIILRFAIRQLRWAIKLPQTHFENIAKSPQAPQSPP